MIEHFVNLRPLALKLFCLVLISAVCAPGPQASARIPLFPSVASYGQELIPEASKPCTEEVRLMTSKLCAGSATA